MPRIALGIFIAFSFAESALAQFVPQVHTPPPVIVAPPVIIAPAPSTTLHLNDLPTIVVPPPPQKLELELPHAHIPHCNDEDRRQGKC
jgi:hypothetical protein